MTDRLSFSHGAPSTSFYLEADQYSQNAAANTSVVRCYLRCINDGNTTSASAASGSHNGYLNGTLFESITGTPFLSSGVASGGTRWRHLTDVTVVHAADGTGSFTVRQYVTDSVATNDQTSGSITLTRIVQVPVAPSGVTVTRVSDTQQTVGWTRNATAIAPYTSQSVRRRTNGGSWATIVSGLSGTATTFSDTTTAAGGKYEYYVFASNTAGSTNSAPSAAIFTTPTAPTGAGAAKDGSGNIVITWANKCLYTEYQTQVWESQNGGAYALLTTVSSGTATYTHTSPSTSVTHQYQVRAKTSSGTALYSAYSVTGTIILSTNPNAPASLTPSGSPQDASAAILFAWVHSSADTAPQSQFQIEHRLTGNAWTTVSAVTSSVSSWSLPAATYANGQTVEWHVRTWGTIGPGPYSATASFVTSTPPTVTISAPAGGSTLTTSAVVLSWAYYDAESTAQTAWSADLLDSTGATLETKAGSIAATTTTFATSVEDASAYSVRVKVRDGSGLWSAYDTAAFTTAFLKPADVAVTPTYDDGFGWMVLALAPVEAATFAWTGTANASTSTRVRASDGTVTNLATNPSFETAAGTVTVRTNRVPNPSAETNTTGWASVRTTLSRDSEHVRSGSWAFKNTITDAANYMISEAVTRIAATASEVLPLIASVWSTATANFSFQTYEYDAGGTLLTPVTSSPLTVVNAGLWVDLSQSITLKATTATVRVIIMTSYQTVGGTWWADNIGAGISTYFDGSTPAAGDFAYAWTGTANASTSIQTGVGVAGALPQGVAAIQSSGWASAGTKSLRMIPTGVSTSTVVYPDGISGMRFGMVAGKTYTAIAKCRLTAPLAGTLDANSRKLVFSSNVGGSTLASTAAPNVAGEYELRLTFTVPVAATSAYLLMYNGASAGNGDVWWDNLTIVEVPDLANPYTGPAFDGSSVSTVAQSTVDVQRSLDAGLTWVTFAAGVSPSATLVDSRATINGTNDYRVIVYSALPSSAVMPTVSYTTTEVKWAYLSSGDGFGTVSRFYANMTLNPTFGRARALYQFAGRTLPVEYDGEFLSESLAVSALLDMSENSFDEFRTQAQTGGTVLWRDPTNRRLFGAISPVQGSQDRAQIGNISFTVTKTDYTE